MRDGTTNGSAESIALRPQHSQPLRCRTLQLHRLDGQVMLFTLLCLLLYGIGGEAIVRHFDGRLVLGTPRLGIDHKQFEEQWFRLHQYALQHKSVDCIFIGDSTVMTDFSPTVFSDSLREDNGSNLECFNFGVGAFSAVGFATLAQLLVHEYSPRLLLVGVEALDFTVPRAEQGKADLAATPWARYRLGEFNLEGWIYENIHLARYLELLKQLATLTLNRNEAVQSAAGEIGGVKDGFYPMEGNGPFNVAELPDPKMDHPYIEHYFAVLQSFQMLPENLGALEEILARNGDEMEVMLVEMPVPSTFYAFFRNHERDYQGFVDTVTQNAERHRVPFLRMQDRTALPAKVWLNYNHLNSEGAPVFSRWLGQAVGLQRTTAHEQVK